MQLGYIGLGKMGKNMVLHVLEKGHDVVAWNRSAEPRAEVEAAGAVTVESIEQLIAQLKTPRVIWLMLPAGAVTGEMIDQITPLLTKGDTIIDGGNSFYKDTMQRAAALQKAGIRFIDVGVSGGPAGARSGACLMIGGDAHAFEMYKQLFIDITAPNALQFFSGNGAGHFVKMVHNGIEYGMMQAIGEGFEVLKESPFHLDLFKVSEVYNNRSVIESRLIGWLQSGYLHQGTELQDIATTIAHSGEGQWTVETAQELNVQVPIIEASLNVRKESANNPRYANRVVNVLRSEFGGHVVGEKK